LGKAGPIKHSLVRFIVLAIFVLLQSTGFVVGQTNTAKFKLGYVKNFDETGDLIWLAKTSRKDRVESKAIARLGYGGTGVINIQGRDIRLKNVGGHLDDEDFKVGRGGFELWEGKDTFVRIEQTYTWLCPEDQENCSVYYYKGLMDVTYKGQKRKIWINGFGGS
jgi:hypothetical protein